MANDKPYDGTFQQGPAAKAVISLSQVLLAPLDAIFKAQIHAARSFLNLVLQMGYPHVKVDANGNALPEAEQDPGWDQVYMQEFKVRTQTDGQEQDAFIRIPALSMIPVAPLSIEQADFDLDFHVGYVYRYSQMQESEAKTLKGEAGTDYNASKRPWFLVSDPVSLRGVVAPSVHQDRKEEGSQEEDTRISIRIKITRQEMPAGLDKLLTTLNQTSSVSGTPVVVK